MQGILLAFSTQHQFREFKEKNLTNRLSLLIEIFNKLPREKKLMGYYLLKAFLRSAITMLCASLASGITAAIPKNSWVTPLKFL